MLHPGYPVMGGVDVLVTTNLNQRALHMCLTPDQSKALGMGGEVSPTGAVSLVTIFLFVHVHHQIYIPALTFH